MRIASPWVCTACVLAILFLAAGISFCAGGDQAATRPAQSQPTSAPAATAPSPTSAPAEESWPPGLLQKGLSAAGGKGFFDVTGLRTYGYVESGFTGRLTGGQNFLPGRVYDARRVNDLRLNQTVFTVDRPYDSSKTFDIGGRADALYGGDAMATHALGLDRMGEGGGENWFDPIQFYLQPWLKTDQDSGLEITVGKFLELAGSESAEATNNLLYSHSYIYNFAEPTTHTGAMAKYIFNSQVFGYFGVVEGWDVFHDNNHAVTYITGGGWSTKDQAGSHPKTQLLLNMITGPEQHANSRDERTLTDVIINQWWTPKLSESVNIDWVTEENVPGAGREDAAGVAHYLTYIFSDYVSGTWRAEWFHDDRGVRTGTIPASWYEMTLGVTITPCPKHKILKNLSFRPEFRWDFADEPVFGGGRKNQLTAAMDMIFKF